jgi:hypothetical protein
MDILSDLLLGLIAGLIGFRILEGLAALIFAIIGRATALIRGRPFLARLHEFILTRRSPQLVAAGSRQESLRRMEWKTGGHPLRRASPPPYGLPN